MSFEVDGGAYQRFMGRYADPLARALLDEIDPHPPQRALDVGAGTGALTAPLVDVLGPDAVSAIDPSSSFATALRRRLPAVDVRVGVAEHLPFDDAAFDLTLAQLVVSFMTDPIAGIAEMARVTAPGGTIAASVWDFGGARAPLSLFWRAARELDPTVDDESTTPGVREGDLTTLFAAAGLGTARAGTLTVVVPYGDPEEWWEPYTLGVGPAGAHVAHLDDAHREALRRRCLELLGPGPGTVAATAWLAVATR
jgi:SAM-dependent methyltransferase